MPTSARILSLDSCTTLFKAFRIMNDNLVSSAFMWDRDEELYKAILTATDVMKACIAFYHGYLSPAQKFSLAEARTWAAHLRNPDQSVYTLRKSTERRRPDHFRADANFVAGGDSLDAIVPDSQIADPGQ